MKNKFLIYTLAAAAVLSMGSLDAKAASLSLGSNAGIATVLESYEQNTMNSEKRIMEYLDAAPVNKNPID